MAARGGEARAGEAHMGPLRLPNGSGTLTAADRDTIWQQFQVSASVRWRAQWGERCLSLSGPPRQLEDAKNMALQMIATHGTEGGRAAPGPTQQEFQQLERQAAAMQQQLTHQQGVLQWLQVQLQKAEQNAAAAYHESIKAKDEAEAAKDEAEAAKDEAKKGYLGHGATYGAAAPKEKTPPFHAQSWPWQKPCIQPGSRAPAKCTPGKGSKPDRL